MGGWKWRGCVGDEIVGVCVGGCVGAWVGGRVGGWVSTYLTH